jgi:hypothetical protein
MVGTSLTLLCLPNGLVVPEHFSTVLRRKALQHRLSSHHLRSVTINRRPQEPLPCESIGLLTHLPLERDFMKNLAIYLAAGASALLVTAASAAPLSPNASAAPESDIQNVRMVCNEAGQCWRQRGERRVIIREPSDSYGYAPRRERYIERRGYGDGGGIGIRAPGVSVGIGTDRY